jgi:hypothetical protein
MSKRTLRAERTSMSAILDRIRTQKVSAQRQDAQSIILGGVKHFLAQNARFQDTLEIFEKEISELKLIVESQSPFLLSSFLSSFNPEVNLPSLQEASLPKSLIGSAPQANDTSKSAKKSSAVAKDAKESQTSVLLNSDSLREVVINPKPKLCPFGPACQRYWELAAAYGFGDFMITS